MKKEQAQSDITEVHKNELPSNAPADIIPEKDKRIFTFGQSTQQGEYLARILLAGAVITNLIAVYYHFQYDPVIPSKMADTALSTWVASVILAGLAALFFSGYGKISSGQVVAIFQQRLSSIFFKAYRTAARFFLNWNTWNIGTILLFAFLIRFIPITKNGLFNDEWYWLDNARLIFRHETVSPFGYIGDQPSNLPAFLVLALLQITGNALIAVRLPGVLFSLVEIAAVYGILTDLFDRRLAKISALLMSVCVWDIHMSIYGWNNVTIAPLLVICVLYFLYRVISSRASTLTWFLLAVFLAVSTHMLYISTLMLIPAGICLLIYWLRGINKQKSREILLFGILFLICVSPVIPKIAKDPLFALGRHKEFLDLSTSQAATSGSPILFYLNQFGQIVKDLISNAGSFDVPLLWGITLEPMIVIFFILGLIVLVYDLIRRKANSYWWVVLGTLMIILIIPQVVLFRFSSVWRSYAAWPVLYLIVGYGLNSVIKFLIQMLQPILGKKINTARFVPFFLVVLYFFISFPWFKAFFPVYTTPVIDYGTGICQPVNDTINKVIPKGSTIFIADEPCYLAISSQYNDLEYRFVRITANFDRSMVQPGNFVVALNSDKFAGNFYNRDLQVLTNQILQEHPNINVTYNINARPEVYLIQ